MGKNRKKLVIEFTFDAVKEFEDEDYETLKLRTIKRIHSDLSDGELDGLGESIAQMDSWQIEGWIAIQEAMTGKSGKVRVKGI